MDVAKAFKEKCEETLKEYCRQDIQLPTRLGQWHPGILDMLTDFGSMYDVCIWRMNVNKHRIGLIGKTPRPVSPDLYQAGPTESQFVAAEMSGMIETKVIKQAETNERYQLYQTRIIAAHYTFFRKPKTKFCHCRRFLAAPSHGQRYRRLERGFSAFSTDRQLRLPAGSDWRVRPEKTELTAHHCLYSCTLMQLRQTIAIATFAKAMNIKFVCVS